MAAILEMTVPERFDRPDGYERRAHRRSSPRVAAVLALATVVVAFSMVLVGGVLHGEAVARFLTVSVGAASAVIWLVAALVLGPSRPAVTAPGA